MRGSVPPCSRFPAGCVFRNRCDHATDVCATRPEWVPTGPDSGYACFHPVPGSGAHRTGTPMNQEAGRG
ncbi:hypothetical protein ACFQ10_02770 [Streptomyces indonesiensis]